MREMLHRRNRRRGRFHSHSHSQLRVRVCLCVCLFLPACLHFLCAAEAAAVTAESLSPSRQPIAVLRTADPAALLDLFTGSAAKPFAPAELDFAGRLPGLGAEVASAVDFLKALAAAGARDVWYCLLPGRGLSRPVAGMGWQLPAGKETTPEGLAAWLEGAALPVGARSLSEGGARSPAAGGQRVAVGPDDGTLRELTAGSASAPERWRSELAAFMASDAAAPALGVWANPRPLLGLASVFGRFDARGALARLGLSVPESVELALRPAADGGGDDDGGLALSLRLARVLPGRKEEESSPGLELLRTDEALLQLHIPSSVAFRLLPAPAWTAYLPLLNLEADALNIQAASLVLWRGPDGDVRWLAAAFLPDAAGFGRNWRKALAAAGDLSGLAGVEDGALRLRLEGQEAWLRPARIDGSVVGAANENAVAGAVLVAAARAGDLPAAVSPVTIAAGAGETAVRWSANLDDAARTQLASAAARLAAGMGLGGKSGGKFSVGELRSALPVRAAGSVALDGDSLVVTSAVRPATAEAPLSGVPLRVHEADGTSPRPPGAAGRR